MISFCIMMGFFAFACFLLWFNAYHKKIICKHVWIVLKDETLPNVMTRFAEATGQVKAPHCHAHLIEDVQQKKIQILVCSDCGKVKRFVTTF